MILAILMLLSLVIFGIFVWFDKLDESEPEDYLPVWQLHSYYEEKRKNTKTPWYKKI